MTTDDDVQPASDFGKRPGLDRVTVIGLCVGAGVLGLMAGVAIGVSGSSGDSTTAPAVQHTVTATVTVSAAAPSAPPSTLPPASSAPTGPAAASIPGDGQFRVGTDVQAGTYQSAGRQGLPCSWGRYDTLAPTSDNHIEMGFSVGQLYATISPEDVLFVSSGCQTWTPVPAS